VVGVVGVGVGVVRSMGALDGGVVGVTDRSVVVGLEDGVLVELMYQ
jgi:hypothetical protein